jgi:predicted DNA-binding protein YlxM (UPF0122 family)
LAKYRKVLPHDKSQVINFYSMAGLSMRVIEKMMGISKTKVFDILHEAESSDKHICLCHNLTSNLSKNGIMVREYAELYRAKNFLIIKGIEPTKVLATICKIMELCFIVRLEPQALVTSFDNFRELFRSYPEGLETLRSDLENLQSVSDNLEVRMATCNKLRLAIDRTERVANNS